jgi:glycosyltransferase involved in cell wall biosynthesis
MDLYNLREVISYCDAGGWRGPTSALITPDGLPAYDDYVAVLRRLNRCVVTTETCRQYFVSCGIPVSMVAPPGVERDVFKPLVHRDRLRRAAGLADRFVVGVFGRNCERKQQPRVLLALATFADSEVVVYFHCQKRGHWYLDELAQDLKLTDRVFFADLESEVRGVAYLASVTGPQFAWTIGETGAALKMPESYSYVERLNCCDLIVNPAHSGDVEHIIIESQSCGVPLAHTDDGGIMTEAVGNGGILLRSIDKSWGRMGERIHLVDPEAISEAIRSVKDDLQLRQQLRERGFDNVQQFSWSRLREAMVQAVESAAHNPLIV